MDYEAVIGLEVHAQLLTKSKIFCGCTTAFGADPNANTCPVCLGMPGVLPVLNKKVVEYGIKTGIALDCEIAAYSIFARKNYFYPDLPKGYQISQYELPLAKEGYLDIDVNEEVKRIGITRAHLEEDAGKLMHEIDGIFTKYPFFGNRQIAAYLPRSEFLAGRHRVRRLMGIMGLQAIYKRPNTAKKHRLHKIWPPC